MPNSDRTSVPAASQPAHVAPSNAPSGRRGLWIAVAAAALWLATLGGLALFTANPITLNVEQIRASRYVVTGRLAERNVVVVERQWKGEELPPEFQLQNVSKTPLKPGRAYVVPLSRTTSGALKVTETALPGDPPLVYPATQEAVAQLTAILAQHSAAQSTSGSGSLLER